MSQRARRWGICSGLLAAILVPGMCRAGELTAHHCVELYLERIQSLDPQLRSVIETNPDALDIAATLDNERAVGKRIRRRHIAPLGRILGYLQ